jgi:hypothetical protein
MATVRMSISDAARITRMDISLRLATRMEEIFFMAQILPYERPATQSRTGPVQSERSCSAVVLGRCFPLLFS